MSSFPISVGTVAGSDLRSSDKQETCVSKHRWLKTSVIGCVVLSILVIFRLVSAPAPQLSFEYRGETIDISADRAWVWQPGGCLQVSWILDDTRPIHIESIERIESGAEQFCPAINRSSPRIELTDYFRDVYRSYELDTYYLPDFLLNLAGVAGLAFFGVIAFYYLWTNDPQKRPSFRLLSLAFIALILCIALLRLSGLELTIVGVLATLRNLFQQRNWQLFGGVLAVMLYVPLIFWAYLGAILAACLYVALGLHSLRLGWKYRRFTYFVVLGGFLVFVLLLYAPFGFATIGHWEDYLKEPKRQCLLGIWLALLLCVGVVESGYALILIVPLLWWYQRPQTSWMNLNLAASWYLIPAFKVMLLSLILLAGRGFYRSNYFISGQDLPSNSFIVETVENISEAYRQTFAIGWRNASDAFGSDSRLHLTLAMLALTAGIAFFLWRARDGDWTPSL